MKTWQPAPAQLAAGKLSPAGWQQFTLSGDLGAGNNANYIRVSVQPGFGGQRLQLGKVIAFVYGAN